METIKLVDKPWGEYQNLIKGKDFNIKMLVVKPGHKLSYQSHEHRNEFWVVLQGTAGVILNDAEYVLNKDMHIKIKHKDKHRLINLGKDTLKVLEVQTGSYFGEDDIIRYDDDYNRETSI